MKTTRLLPFATLCGLLLASAGAQAVTCQNNIPPSNPDSIYTSNNDGTVTDTRTGLMWKQCVEGLSGTDCATGSATLFTWAAALAHAEGHSFAGHDDWRLPNIKELRSLVEECRTDPAINDTVFPATPLSYARSGSPYAGFSDSAWVVAFTVGHAAYYNRSNNTHVRLVRGGQSFDPLPENGACGTAHGVTTLTAPSGAALCSAGTAGSVSTAVDGFTWSCAGANGGTTDSCSAPRQYTVTPSAGANGAISPTSAQNVTYHQTTTFTVTPNAGYTASIAGTCPAGSWSGNDYTTGQVVRDCTVAASFEPAPLVLPEGPDRDGALGLEVTGPGGWTLTQASTAPAANMGTPPPSGVTLPHGVVSLTLELGAPGTGTTVVLTYPSALPPGTRYYKYGPTAANPAAHWYEYPHAVISGNTITLTLTDGGLGDGDLAANSRIVDPGGPALMAGSVAAIPTLSQWATMLLAGIMGWLAYLRLGRMRPV